MNLSTRTLLLPGPAGAIDVALDLPRSAPLGCAVIAHPHPLHRGTRDNKVAQTLARALVASGFAAWRPNFRGVGASEGTHDEGRGETDDLVTVVAHARAELGHHVPLVLAGFSFGAFVQTRVAAELADAGTPAQLVVLVGPAVEHADLGAVPPETLVIHGEVDETVPLSAVFNWARPLEIPVVVIPGADHFFHRRLTLLKRLVEHALLPIVLGARAQSSGDGAASP